MPKLPALSGKQLIKILTKLGFSQVRQKGSHISLEKRTASKNFRTVVPFHSDLAKGTLRDILNQCGLTKDDLINEI